MVFSKNSVKNLMSKSPLLVVLMYNRDTILQKIDAQEQEWNRQINHLQSKVDEFDTGRRLKSQIYVSDLNSKLKIISILTEKLRKSEDQLWDKHTGTIEQCWEELVHNVDFIIANYRKIFSD